MAELEIHHESEHGHDPAGQKVGVLAAVLAVLLAIVSIASHRTHTDAILAKSAANDAWQHYQSSRVKYHNLELGEDLFSLLGARAEAEAKKQDYEKQKAKYEEQAKDIQKEARDKEAEGQTLENRALRYDLGEGLLEIALVLSSLYFIARKRLFPVIGVIAGVLGVVIAAAGLIK